MYIEIVKNFPDFQSAINEVLATSWSLGMSELRKFSKCKTYKEIDEALESLENEEHRGFTGLPTISVIDYWEEFTFTYETFSGKNEVLFICSARLCTAYYTVFTNKNDWWCSSAAQAFLNAGWALMTVNGKAVYIAK